MNQGLWHKKKLLFQVLLPRQQLLRGTVFHLANDFILIFVSISAQFSHPHLAYFQCFGKCPHKALIHALGAELHGRCAMVQPAKANFSSTHTDVPIRSRGVLYRRLKWCGAIESHSATWLVVRIARINCAPNWCLFAVLPRALIWRVRKFNPRILFSSVFNAIRKSVRINNSGKVNNI